MGAYGVVQDGLPEVVVTQGRRGVIEDHLGQLQLAPIAILRGGGTIHHRNHGLCGPLERGVGAELGEELKEALTGELGGVFVGVREVIFVPKVERIPLLVTYHAGCCDIGEGLGSLGFGLQRAPQKEEQKCKKSLFHR